MKKLLIGFSSILLLLFGSATGAFASSNTYNVKSKDTLFGIAKSNRVSVKDLIRWNHLTSDNLAINQVLIVSSSASNTVPKPSPATKGVKTLTVTATAYTVSCQGCRGITSLGINLKKNPNLKVISVDPHLIKLGTKVYVEGYGYAIAGDKGRAIKGNIIDVFIPSQKRALNWGRKTVKVTILN
ncbi:MAG: 3D domain-containing protein [Bacillota bacterium]|nr:3D domain-containing protein [Bacillota bacterium]MDP4169870.1 3D domain-containing protein [Bacillota bacterium]